MRGSQVNRVSVWLLLVVALTVPCGSARAEEFVAFRARLVKVFTGRPYITLATVGRHHGGEIRPKEEGQGPWAVMVREVEQAEEGPGMRDPSGERGAIQISYLKDPSRGLMEGLWYVGGRLGPEDGPRSLRVGPTFGRAVEELIALSEKREAALNAGPENAASWPVQSEQAIALARRLVKAAGGDVDAGSWYTSESRDNGRVRQYTITVGHRVEVVVDGADGSILWTNSLKPPDRASPLSKTQALRRGRAIAAAMGVTGAPSLEKCRVSDRHPQGWQLVWKGPGEGQAVVQLDALTGELVLATESLKNAHPRVPSLAEAELASLTPAPPPAPGSVRITAPRAKRIAAAFATRAQLPLRKEAPVLYRESDAFGLLRPSWEVGSRYSAQYTIEADSGAVISWYNFPAFREASNPGVVAKGTARKAAEKAFRDLGRPADAVFKGITYARWRKGTAASWTVRWERRTPQGVPFQDDTALVQVNAETGQVCCASLSWSSPRPENTGVTVTKEQAINLARAAAGQVSDFTAAAELKVVRAPADEGGSLDAPRRDARLTRTAWVVDLTQTVPSGGFFACWVDATNGKVLNQMGAMRGGGMGGRGRPSRSVARPSSPSRPRQSSPAVVRTRLMMLGGALLLAVLLLIALASLLCYLREKREHPPE